MKDEANYMLCSNIIILTNGYVSSVQDSYFLSAEECITAGHFQNQQSNACRLSPDGHFGSKFVTVVATGMQHPPLHEIYCCWSDIQCGDKLRCQMAVWYLLQG